MRDASPKRRRRGDKDIVLDRDENGRVYASLPWTIRHYGVENFDWGYIGPATAELALNVLDTILPPGVDGEPAIPCEEGECSATTWRLHRSFMAEFLVRVPYEGGCLAEADIRRWILHRFDDGHGVEVAPSARWLSTFAPR
ncbi:MAG TPA: hypothetical protein VF267_01410 [Gammaproteobacteria bacterium]